MEVPFPGGCPQVDACKDVSVGDCPIETGETFDYKMTMKIESFFPAVSIMEVPGIYVVEYVLLWSYLNS